MISAVLNDLAPISPAWNGLSPFMSGKDADVRAWQAALIAAGTSASSSTLAATNQYVRRLKAANLWNRIYMLDHASGNNLTASLIRLKVPTGIARAYTNFNFVNGDFTETGASGGRKGDGTTKYLDTLVNPVTLGWDVQNLMLWQYARETDVGGTSTISMGSETGAGTNGCLIGWVGTGTIEAVRITGSQATQATMLTGLICGGTNSSTTLRLYNNGAAIGGTAVQSGTILNGTLYAHGNNTAGAPSGRTPRRISQLIISAGFSAAEVLVFYNIVQAYETALGRNV